MTANWIQEAALAAHPPWENGGGIDVHESKRAAFIAGVELGIEQSAVEVEKRADPFVTFGGIAPDPVAKYHAACIRALGSDNEEE